MRRKKNPCARVRVFFKYFLKKCPRASREVGIGQTDKRTFLALYSNERGRYVLSKIQLPIVNCLSCLLKLMVWGHQAVVAKFLETF